MGCGGEKTQLYRDANSAWCAAVVPRTPVATATEARRSRGGTAHGKVGRVMKSGSVIAIGCAAVMSLLTGCMERQAQVDEEVVMTKKVMISPLAGRWYQDSESALRFEIEGLSKDRSVVRQRGICAVVVPHAGYRYSGKVAVGVYKRVDPRDLKRIVVMGPSHYVPMRNQLSIPDATHIRTPLGDLRVDNEFVKRARELPFVIHAPEAHTQEHSDQIQLPLIQSCLATNLPIVCMVCGQFDAAHLLEAATSLRGLLDEGTLVVASSDFTHHGASFGYQPFTNNVLEKIEALDMGIFDLFAYKDLSGFLKRLDDTGATVCGRDPLALVLAMLPQDAKVERTAYDTSGRQTHDTQTSVSYLGALVSGSWSKPAVGAKEAPVSSAPITEEDGKLLLKLARDSIVAAFKQGEQRAAHLEPPQISAGMCQIRGAFVTLNMRGRLRGCIGEIVPRREAWRTVREQALNAAFNDPRFDPLRETELKELEIEISLLTPPRPVASWREIVIGKHGMVLNKGRHSAVFLPQVAPEQGWDLETTLTHLAMKAGLGAQEWREGADYLVFEAQILQEQR